MAKKTLGIFQKFEFLIILVFFAISNLGFSQSISSKFQVINDSEFSISEKEKKFDSLLFDHEKNKDNEFLLGDRYEILKWFYQQNNLEKAISLNKENLKLMDSLNFDNKTFYRRNMYSLGFYLMSINNTSEAIKYFNLLIDSNIVDEYAYYAYSSIANIAYSYEDYYLAAEQFESAKNFAKKNNNAAETITNILGAGYAYKIIKSDESIKKGILIAYEGLELLKKNKDEIPYFNHYSYNLHELLGDLYNEKKDYNFDISFSNYKKALNYAFKINDSLRLADIHNNIGYLHLKDSRKEAIDYFNKAFTYNPDVTMLSILNRNKSEYYLKRSNKQKALKFIQKSINTLTKIDTLELKSLPNSISLKDQNFKFLLLSSLTDKARIWIDLSNQKPYEVRESYENALKPLRLADELVDIIRLETNENKSKLFWRETASEIYVNATKVCFELNKPKEAFYFMEKNKALLLLEDLNKKQLLQNSNIPENIVSREAFLNNEIAEHSNSKTKDNYRRFIDSLDTKYRMYYKSQKPADVISLKTTQNTLETNNVYLEFILDDNKGYGLLITKDSTYFYDIKNCKTLKQNATQLRQLLGKPLSSLADQDQYNTVSNSIYKSLFPDTIKGVIKGKSLTIIPDYYLQNIPFEALQIDEIAHSYLIFQNEINYAYSISLLNNNEKLKRTHNNKLIGFAPINFKDLSTLNNSETELDIISDLMASEMYINNEATKSNFINHVNDYNIIHIASHANAGNLDDENPWIAFHDEQVNLQEIYRLNHQAELVVLSACETSLGANYKGEGVMSLTRGFFNSGANSVVSTLWNINDKSSTEIIGEFYSNINNGNDKSLALHNAKIEYIKSSDLSEKSPYYWASFILIGDAGHIINNNNQSYFYYFIFGIILLIIITLFFRNKKN